MDALPQTYCDQGAVPAPVSLADANSAGAGAAPPHLLWETLESAYAAPEERPADPDEPRLARYIGLPIALGLSLVLWVAIVVLVLMLMR